ncbi:MAG: SusD/RagB family nutrient-binding outer membrane lipoprotein [Pseudopedobacter saltans]|uniref:SusD/RagB family nutrient-binding outer membrane lipoprotein n=1 Tax=Pseudopedobacter saltans TaxID=151895 RepID=A0A2W5FCF6_9SPHI|nr:MAG: SusD/RagB family nutrient-binding outer membrane lipoprotein [Pseudopedobacter saltans]
MRKKHFNINIKYALVGCIATSIAMTSCTKKFDEWNTDKYAAANATLLPGVGTSQLEIFHDYQTGINLSEDSWSGYMMSPSIGNFGGGSNNLNYNFGPNWQNNSFNPVYRYTMAKFKALNSKGLAELFPEVYATTRLIEVTAIARVTDRFGAIPYSSTGTIASTYAYDTQKDVYSLMFSRIDSALTLLKNYTQTYPGVISQVGDNDFVYAGDMAKWIKYANTLRLRLAMHIVKVDPATAKLQGEKALADAGGLLSDASDVAKIKIYSGWNGGTNDYNLVAGWGDTRANAAIVSYMNGYNDPRISKYFLPATDASVSGQYIGIRIGGIVGNRATYVGYSNLNIDGAFAQTSSQLIMSSAEAWFLKAEAALRGWTGAGDAQTNYQQGITVSMNEWGATIGDYLNNATGTQTAYTDPNGSSNNSPALSTITVKWDNAASNEQKLERIITQKWIAIFPDGADAWADYRRTGYPKLFPVVVNNSGGTISTSIQIRRMPYPSDEYLNNASAVAAAVQNTLGGKDNGGTRVWWDVDGSNF